MAVETFPITSIGSAAAAVVDKLRDKVTPNGVERFHCADDATWHALRAGDVTASTVAALLGEHEWETLYSLYMTKTGAVKSDVEDSGPVRRGRLLEPVAVQVLREDHPDWKVIHNSGATRTYYRDTAARIGATPDVLVTDPARGPGVVQIKSVEASIYRRKWCAGGETPEPPLWIAVQAIVEAALTGASWAAVAPIVVGFGVDMPLIDIPIHAGVLDRVKAEVAEFWRRVEAREAYAPDYRRDSETIRALYGGADDGSTIDLSGWNRGPELAAEDEKLKAIEKDAKEQRAALKAELLEKIGPASVAMIDGRVFCTAKTIHRKGYEVKPSSYRDIRIK